MSLAAELSAFRAALEAAQAMAGATSPNPPVGCVILDRAGAMLALEAHRKAGGPHAEALAIADCRERGLLERVHTVVVTLEPCAHHGRTPPCVDAILGTPARRVIIGCADPNPRVPGQGARRLTAAGLEVAFIDEFGDEGRALGTASRRLIAPFSKWARTGRPWVTVKQALDPRGGMIPPAGSKTFTSAASLELAHRLRRRADAIITGSGTVLADLPEFTVRRVADHTGKRRALAILDRRRRVAQTYLEAARARGFEPFVADDIEAALTRLGEVGSLEALVEAGPTLLAEIEARNLWDEWITIRRAADGGEDEVTTRLRAAP